MPTTASLAGKWTAYAARLVEYGEIKYGSDGVATSTSDTYAVWVPTTSDRLPLSSVTGLPAVGSAHPAESTLELAGYRIGEHAPGEQFWRIYVDYEGEGENEETGGGGGEPPEEVGRVTALDYPAYTSTGDLVQDQESGGKVLNSAGDVFDSVPQIETVWIGVHFVRRVKDFPSAVLALAGTVNSAQVKCYGLTFPKRTARLRIGCRYMFDGSKRPYELDVTLEPRHNYLDTNQQYRPSGVLANYENGDIGWDIAILDCGYQYKSSGDGKKYRFLTKDEAGVEAPAQSPQLLKADGDDGRTYSNESYLVVRTAKGASWAALDLPEHEIGWQPPPPNQTP